MPVVSIIVPTFNRANVLGRSIKSVLGQSWPDFELIIVDDGSTDNSEEVIASFADKRIRYTKHEHNQGQNAALNTGVMAATGQYVAFLDSDDEWLPQFLEKIILTFKQDKFLGAVYSRAWTCSNKGELREGYKFQLQGEVYKEALAQGHLSYMITIVVKKEIMDLLKPIPFDPILVYGQDDDFCFRVAKICKIGLIAEPLAIIHSDGDLQGGEVSICKRKDIVAEGRQRLLDKYKDDILALCGTEILASKYLSCAKAYLHASKIEKARSLFIYSNNIRTSFNCMLYLLYCDALFLRWLWLRALRIYRFMKRATSFR
jgi:glycosyltransferase involved in cell wall biosynthesis